MIDAFETENELISVAEFIPGELYRYEQVNQWCGSGSKLDPYSASLWSRIFIPNMDPHNLK